MSRPGKWGLCDGALDVLVSNSGEAPLLLRKLVGAKNNWLGLRLIGTRCNVDAVGAKVTWRFGTRQRSRLKTAGGSFLSSHDPRMVLGIGQASRVEWVEIRWPAPSGRVERFTTLPVGKYVTIREGAGKAVA